MGFLTDVGSNTAVARLLNLAEAGRQVGPLRRIREGEGEGKRNRTDEGPCSSLLPPGRSAIQTSLGKMGLK